MNTDSHNTIKETLEELLMLMDYPGAVIVTEREATDGTPAVVCNISVEKDAHLLIGQHGDNLRAVQHLATLLARRKNNDIGQFTVDVNAYRAEKEEHIIRMAKDAAAQTLREKKPVVLQPMGGYERRIVHVTLADDESVVTESIGEGDERKVVVRAAGVGAA